jgi:hypothetical protein
MNKEVLEFDVLGTKVKFTPQAEDNLSLGVTSDRIVNTVLERMDYYRKNSSTLTDKDIAVLTALEFAKKSMEFEREFKINIESLEGSINSALEHIETAD